MSSKYTFRLTAFVSSDHPNGGNVRTISTGHDTDIEAAREAEGAELHDGEELFIEVIDPQKNDRIVDRVDPDEVTT
ncbi:hypothetical protein [Salinibacter ruber]|uniref:Uncharacterized protein n=1 Tax=Salinibacter ruber TaxID=146919 RepID=A0AAW5P7G3_9BACT|nr:hypothetical protein [Salinibacter ruber]MCS4157818.1 hypothetical protein [Salinibacter ruber]